MNARGYFIGAGIHTVLGRGVDSHVQALRQAPSAPQNVPVEFARQSTTVPYQLLAGAAQLDAEQRLYRALEAVIADALEAAQLDHRQRRAAGLFVGSSSFDISASEILYRGELRSGAAALALRSCSIGNMAAQLCRRFGLRGPDYSFNTACTASANALLYADAMIRSDRLQHAVVVGVELFNAITALGFDGLELLTREVMKPFDRARAGLALGEGCAALVLSAQPRRGDEFHLRGGANMCDRYSVSAANPDGSTVAAVIQQALAAAALPAAAITALKTHGTASLRNDEAEVAGMRQVFAELPPLCALKPFIGHTLGACGLNELILFCAAAERGFLPGTPGICAADSDLGVTLNQSPMALAPGHFMLNYFGFGGNNTSLVVSNRSDSQ
jgi:3-oxoacyl-[acyl-carrier-protein] synthase I